MNDLLSLAFTTAITAFVINIAIASYGVFTKTSLLKKAISIIIFSDSISILAIAIGFRTTETQYPSPPVLGEKPRTPSDVEAFVEVSVDPLPQAFVITAIVIGLAAITLLLGLIILYYRHFGTTDIRAPLDEEYEEVI
ncbi:MAG: NADH-quinone oxidoreductase subunit K [Sulfolobales archaeon]|nr:NADH-quinone oxidoreductase subunit K [Sulfolobales archaeon]MCX8199647.1 NADH-quinone oxidoreductase subunit K [Sulfolobales archaeon]MDW8170601.1 NADH-quinone oxidoreductase subunit K [Desulfurococcaceae archaeon]